jgi:ribulose-phosphate 3-epimerase
MIEILPAILPSSFDDLAEHVARLGGVAKHVQVDVVDGHYARGKTWPYKDASSFATLVAEESGLPQWDHVDYQFDLMVEHPEAVVLDYVRAGATQLIVHAASPGAKEALQGLVDRREEMGTFAVQVGVALGAHAGPADLEPFEGLFDFVQVMGIEHIGKQGEPLIPPALYLVERLRSLYPHMPLQVDGGVTKDNALSLVRAGANRLIAGSAIFGQDDPVAAYKELYNLANAH